jgi:hypothetical protein
VSENVVFWAFHQGAPTLKISASFQIFDRAGGILAWYLCLHGFQGVALWRYVFVAKFHREAASVPVRINATEFLTIYVLIVISMRKARWAGECAALPLVSATFVLVRVGTILVITKNVSRIDPGEAAKRA